MGAVHGVYLKYVGMSAISYAGYTYLNDGTNTTDIHNLLSGGRTNFLSSIGETGMISSLIKLGSISILKYSTIINGSIAIMFKLERGMGLIGKDHKRGTIPLWSYILYFPFHLPTILYTYVHTNVLKHTIVDEEGNKKKELVPVASEVQPGWWVGGCYSNQLNKDWGGVVDLTVEFPESCITRTKAYHLVTSWDGVPPDPARLEKAAVFAANARKDGDVLIHCAHGRGRSTTVMCAALVRAGLYDTWEEAFEKGIKPGRSVCKLNRRMRDTLAEWQETYVDKQKKTM